MEQKKLTSKEIKTFILDSSKNLDRIITFLEKDYETTIKGIISALYPLLKNYDQNESRVKYLICLLQQLISIAKVTELKILSASLVNLNDLILNLNLKQRINLSIPIKEIQEMQKKITEKEMQENYNDKIKYLSFLIYQDKEFNHLKMIEKLLDSIDNLLEIKNENHENIFEELLNKYLYLDEKNWDEINYFYEIILIFIKSKYGKYLLEDSKQYFRMIKRSKLEYKDHIIKLMSLLDPEFEIPLSDLEERYKINFSFPNVIIKESQKFKLNSKDRYDFTYQDAITIDGRGSTCLDDALYIEKNKDGSYTLYIHIVDVSSLIPYNSLTRNEASIRGESLYLSNRTIPMYPEHICNNLCSLLPGYIRNTQTSIYKLDPNFHIIEDSYRIVKGKIKSVYQTTYESVDERIKNLQNTSYDILIEQLMNFASVRRKNNPKKEDYRKLQNALEFDPKRESLRLDYSSSSNIVHESMILENYSRAKYMQQRSLPYIYRILTLPSNDFIEKQLKQLKALDSKYVGSPEFFYNFKTAYARSKYSATPSQHMGLHLPIYSHSSAPARRYSDLECQYMVNDIIFKKNRSDFNLQVWEYRVEQTVKYLNENKKNNEVFSDHYNYLTHKKLIKGKK